MKNKYKILFLILIIVGTCAYVFYESKKIIIETKTEKIQINQKIYNTDIIKNLKNGKITTEKKINKYIKKRKTKNRN